MDKINQLKIEIFDIIREQERLQVAFQQLEQSKQKKVRELMEEEKATSEGQRDDSRLA